MVVHASDPDVDLSELIKREFPTTIAVLYHRMLEETNWEVKTHKALKLYETWMKSNILQMLVQYLDQDIDNLQNEETIKLNEALVRGIHRPSLGLLVDIFFHLLGVYRRHQDRLFIPELHGIRWKPGGQSTWRGYRTAFDALVPIRNDLDHGAENPIWDENWQEKYDHVIENLDTVLGKFTFIRDYRILCKLDDGRVLQFRGMEPKQIEPFPPELETLQPGRIYMEDCRSPRRLHELYPLYLHWPSEFFKWERGEETSDLFTASYHSYTKSNIRFSVATAWVEKLVLTDEAARERFLQLFEAKLESLRLKHRAVESLDWDTFKEIIREITEIETESIQNKFSRELYLERRHITIAFEHFLGSNKGAFVLLGKSGVGKSSFLMSMQENCMQDQGTCLLVLDSIRIPGEADIIPFVTGLFAKHLQLRDDGRERRIEDILTEIGKIDGIENKKVVLAFDAINESADARKLLGQIDQLVSHRIDPWLKVVITSRPEAWQNLKRFCRLTESRYYRQPNTQELEVELKGFDVEASGTEDWVAMDHFKPVELPKVYALYQARYLLKTSYDELSPGMKVLLQDPLALRLVAETYGSKKPDYQKDGILPSSIRTSKLYEKYVNSLIDDKRLDRGDVTTLLEKRILPLMFRPGGYSNTLDTEILTETISEHSGRPLADEIEMAEIVPSTGKRVNQSFQNLVDADILAKQGTYSDYKIGFKYERFYDYFGGKYIYENHKSDNDKENIYKELISLLDSFPFLWGSIRNAIFTEFDTGSRELIFSLAREDDRETRELLISILSEYGQEPGGKETIDSVIQRLLATDRSKPDLVNWLRLKLLGTDNSPLSTAARSASQTALEVARRLSLLPVLEVAAVDPSALVRIKAVRNIYYFWRDHPAEGFEVFERIVEQTISKGLIPHIPALESALALSILFMRHYYPDTPEGRELGSRILVEMRKIMMHVFLAGKGGSRRRPIFMPVIRNLVVNAVIQFVVKTQEAYPEDKPSFLNEVSDLVQGSPEIKARYDRLVDYFEKPTKLANIRDDLDQAVIYNDTLTNGLMWLIIMLDFISGREQDIAILEDLADLELEQPKVGSTNEGMIVALGLISLYIDDVGDPIFQQLERMTVKYIHRTRGLYYARNGTQHPNLALNQYMTMRCMRQNYLDRDLPKEFLEQAIREEDWLFFSMILDALATQVSTTDDFRNAQMSLESLRAAFPLPKESKAEEKVIDTLARIRLYQRKLVDQFLMEIDPNNGLLPRVLRVEVDENVWSELFHNIYAKILVRLLQTKEIKDELVRILRQATKQKNLRTYLKVAVKDLMNSVTGEKIFKVDI